MNYFPNEMIDSNELFVNASSKLAENYKGIELSDNISSFITGSRKKVDDESETE